MRSFTTDRAYELIRGRIISGYYLAGHPLLSEKLAPELGTSRTPVRHALRQLAIEGLVAIHPRSGISVRSVDRAEFMELCDTRLALECHTAFLAAKRRSVFELNKISCALDRMRLLVERMAEQDCTSDLEEELAMEDARFHIAIMSAAHNRLIKREILRLHLISRVMRGLGRSPRPGQVGQGREEQHQRRRDAVACHRAIYEAIEEGDGCKARNAMERHIREIIASWLTDESFVGESLPRSGARGEVPSIM